VMGLAGRGIQAVVRGHKQVRRRALKLEENIRRKANRRATGKAMTPVIQAARKNLKQQATKSDQTRDEKGRFLAQVAETAAKGRSGIVKSLKKKTTTKGSVTKTVVATAHPLAHFLELGTQPHGIRSRHGRLMTFMIKGREVTALAVWHPGAKPYPYLVPALNINNKRCRAIYIRELKAAVKHFTVKETTKAWVKGK
jgi:HK97 gp10 family phage protein